MATEVIGGLSAEAGAALGAGIAMGLSALAAAWSQGSVGAAAMGLAAERPEFEKKLLIYLVLPEILALLGFAIAFLLVQVVSAK
ncbi:TPA: ATPase [Candidatus Micrarchaeota archaeon]|nr:ATPase [Candidatus Micrarchaeota archaeon]